MRILQMSACALLVSMLMGALPLSAQRAMVPEEIVSICLQPLPDDEATLSIQLASPGNITLYYDSQPPQNADRLETYWFRERSDTRSENHTFTLDEIEPGKVYYFRLVVTWPTERWCEPMRWTIPARSKDLLVIK